MALILAAFGAVFIFAGVALVSVPAALIVAGVELVAAGYVARYMEVKREAARTSR